jgi:hypothetical protein
MPLQRPLSATNTIVFPPKSLTLGLAVLPLLPQLSRYVEELLFVRGVLVSYEAIRKWCQKFGQAYANQL